MKVQSNFLKKMEMDERLETTQNLQEENQKGSRFLGSNAVSILNKWFMENRDYPYPNEMQTDLLASQAGN